MLVENKKGVNPSAEKKSLQENLDELDKQVTELKLEICKALHIDKFAEWLNNKLKKDNNMTDEERKIILKMAEDKLDINFKDRYTELHILREKHKCATDTYPEPVQRLKFKVDDYQYIVAFQQGRPDAYGRYLEEMLDICIKDILNEQE